MTKLVIPVQRPPSDLEQLIRDYPKATEKDAPGKLHAIADLVYDDHRAQAGRPRAIEFLMQIGDETGDPIEPSSKLRMEARSVLIRRVLKGDDPRYLAAIATQGLKFFSEPLNCIVPSVPLESIAVFMEACYSANKSGVYDRGQILCGLVYSRHYKLLIKERLASAVDLLLEWIHDRAFFSPGECKAHTLYAFRTLADVMAMAAKTKKDEHKWRQLNEAAITAMILMGNQ